MTVINTNTASINAQFNLSKVNKEMEAAMEQLSSGKRINTASDDAAGMAISSRITSEVKGIEMAIRNASDGQALIDTAEGAHVEIENMLQRARELAVQASNDTNSDDDRASLQLEIDQLLTEIDRTAANTSWAGKTLMGGETGGASEFSFQVGTGNAAADRVSISIAEMSSVALGIGSSGTASGGRAVGPAGVSYADGTLTVVGVPKAGDTFTFDLNGTAVSTTFSEVDQYPDNAAGAAAQIKAAVDVLIANNPTTLGNVSVKNNDNGTLSFSQGTSATLDTFTGTANTAVIDEANGTVTFTGSTAEAIALNVNGTNVSVTLSTTDGFDETNAGTASAMAQAIQNTAGLENIVVTDHADGSLTIKQLDAPFIEALEVTPTTVADVSITYDDGGVLTVAGAWTEGQQISMDILGESVSFTVKDDDAYGNTLAGISSQLAAAINDAGISGLTAAKNANANTVTITDTMNVTNATVDSGSSFITHTIGDAATSVINLSAADVAVGSATADTPATGDAYSFSVNGHELKLVVGTDGYTDDIAGVSEQMKDLIDGLNIEGLTVTANTSASTTSGVSMARVLTGTGTVGSTVVTNITSLGADEIGDPTFSGAIDVSSAAASADAIDRIDAALLAINTQRAELGAVSNRMDYTINNLSNVSSNLQSGLSRIQDADFAKVTGDLTKSQIMSQAATAMLAQANASKQGVLSLLQG